MRRYQCNCGNTLFFDNSLCVNCGMELGFCPTCKNLVPLLKTEIGYRCGNDACGASLSKCSNYTQYQVCNRCVVLSTTEGQELCECCHFNQTIPDLTIPGNLERWRRLESAKRRLFYDLDRLALPYETGTDQFELSLAFDFKADAIPEGNFWRSVGVTIKGLGRTNFAPLSEITRPHPMPKHWRIITKMALLQTGISDASVRMRRCTHGRTLQRPGPSIWT